MNVESRCQQPVAPSQVNFVNRQGNPARDALDQRARIIDLVLLFLFLGVAACGLFAVSQLPYKHGDEGFHLLASYLISVGKRPYFDFFYQHLPLYLLVNAGWMHIFGATWRSAHALSALLVAASAVLLAGYLYTRLPGRPWRLLSSIVVAAMFVSNILVTRYLVLGQPLALAVILLISTFLLSLRTVRRDSSLGIWPGVAAGAAVATSLLTAPMAALSFGWILAKTTKSARWRKGLQFCLGAALSFVPVLWFAVPAPRQMFWDVVVYHFSFRYKAPLWPGQDFGSLALSWLSSPQAVVLVVLALVGVGFAFNRRQEAAEPFRSEQQFCILMGLCCVIYCASVRPTFPQYFAALIPFLAILATVGLLTTVRTIFTRPQGIGFAGIVLAVILFDGAKSVRHQMLSPPMKWTETGEVAQQVNRVLPTGCPLYAEDAAVYFAAHRVPPTGLENNYAFYLNLPARTEQLLHIIPQTEIDRMVKGGRFGGVVTWSGQQAESIRSGRLYRREETFPGHWVFWDWAGASAAPCGKTEKK